MVVQTLLRVIAVCALVFAYAPSAFAGAWPRAEGTWFLSFHGAQELNWNIPSQVSTYLEYGLTDRWTVGGKLEFAYQTQEMSDGMLFARWHPQSSGNWQQAVSLTLSGLEGVPILAPAFHLGRGLQTPFGGGWTDMSFRVELPFRDGTAGYAAFAQVGVKPHDRFMAMLSVDVFADKYDTTLKLLPAVAWQMPSGRHLHLEWSETLAPDPISKLSLGIWLEF